MTAVEKKNINPPMASEWINAPNFENYIVDHVIVGKMEGGEIEYVLVGFGVEEFSIEGNEDLSVTSQKKLVSMVRLPLKRAESLLKGLVEHLGDEAMERLGYVRK